MTQQERINLLCVEQRELGDLLSGMQACASIPPVFIAMARTKALRIAEELMKLEAETADTPSSPVAETPKLVAEAPKPVADTPSSLVAEAPKPVVEAPKPIADTPSSPVVEAPKPVTEASKPVVPTRPSAPVPVEPVVTSPRGDIRSLLTMGDKFLFQRELFRGDIGMLNYTLDRLNKLEGMREAEAFVRSEFRWADDAPGVKEFYELLERYYLNTII